MDPADGLDRRLYRFRWYEDNGCSVRFVGHFLTYGHLAPFHYIMLRFLGVLSLFLKTKTQACNNGAGDSNPKTVKVQIAVTTPQGIIKNYPPTDIPQRPPST